MIILVIYLSWKPYNWHKNNPQSIIILKEHGYPNPGWRQINKAMTDKDNILLNDRSIAQFGQSSLNVIYWPSVREITWCEFEGDKKKDEYIDILDAHDNIVAIDSDQKKFEQVVDMLKRKFPEFAENWDKRSELPEDEEIGTFLFQKYPRNSNGNDENNE